MKYKPPRNRVPGVVIFIAIFLFILFLSFVKSHPVVGFFLLLAAAVGVIAFLILRRRRNERAQFGRDHSVSAADSVVPEKKFNPGRATSVSAAESIIPEMKPKPGKVEATLVQTMGLSALNETAARFVAFDLETTGLDHLRDEVIEFSAVVFKDGAPTYTFSRLARPGNGVPPDATRVNGITYQMVKDCEPTDDVAMQFYQFLRPYIETDTMLVAHNAAFDAKFLMAAWMRIGIDTKFTIADTLSFERQLHDDLENYKLGTVADYYGLHSELLHRAEADATLCGFIFKNQLDLMRDAVQTRIDALTPMERDFMYKVFDILKAAEKDLTYLTFTASSYFSVDFCSRLIRAKLKGRACYALVPRSYAAILPADRLSDATPTEGADFVRYSLTAADDLNGLTAVILAEHEKCYADLERRVDHDDRYLERFAKSLKGKIIL